MIQVYKKNELFIIENTVTDIIYPNLTREEALVLLKKFDRDEPEDRCDFAIKEDNVSFEYASIDDKDQQISDLEAKLAEAQKTIEIQKMSNNALQEENLDYRYDITDTAYEQAKYMAESWEEDYQQEITELQKQLAEKEKEMSIKSIIRTLVKYNNLNCTFRDKTNSQIQQCGDVYNSNYGYFNFEDDYDECLNNRNDSRFDIISIDLDNQDKISFAIEQLEKLKVELHIIHTNGYLKAIDEEIDNQINELKGE